MRGDTETECAPGIESDSTRTSDPPRASNTVTGPDSAATYHRRQPGSNASTSGSSPTGCQPTSCIVERSITGRVAFASPAAKSCRRAAPTESPWGWRAPVTGHRATTWSAAGSIAAISFRVGRRPCARFQADRAPYRGAGNRSGPAGRGAARTVRRLPAGARDGAAPDPPLSTTGCSRLTGCDWAAESRRVQDSRSSEAATAPVAPSRRDRT